MNCPNCGAFLGKEDVFCGECGQPVAREGAPSSVATPEEVKDLDTDLLPIEPATAPPAPAARPAAPPVRPAVAAARPAAGGKRFPLIPVLIGAGIAIVGLCVCAAAALFFLADNAATPTPVDDVSSGDLPTAIVDLEPTEALVVPTGGAVIYEDNFDSPDSGWDVYDDEDTWAGYDGGGYRLGVRTDNFVTWANPTSLPDFTNFQVEVDTRLVEGPLDNNLGVLVRYQHEDDDNYYWFQISSDGYYAIDLMQDGEWIGLQDWQTSDAIVTGMDAVNHILVVCSGNEFAFYVNDTYLTSVTDDTYSTGSIGLAVGTFDEPGVVVEFDNLRVRALDQ